METALPILLKYATLDTFNYRYWTMHDDASDMGTMMQLWMTAASALLYTNDIGQSVVETLLLMAHQSDLRPYIPVLAWDWLKKRPVFNSHFTGLERGTDKDVVQMVRNLGDVGLITSFLFVVWSKCSWIVNSEFQVMLRLVREELYGIGAAGYRADLIQRLDDILPQLEPGSDGKQQYEEFRTALLEVDEEAMKTLVGMSWSRRPFFSTNMCACMCSVPLYLHVCASSSVPVVVCRLLGTPSSKLSVNSL